MATADPHIYVDFVRDGNPRSGALVLRLCERWTATAIVTAYCRVDGGRASITYGLRRASVPSRVMAISSLPMLYALSIC